MNLLELIEDQKREFDYRFGLGLYTRYATQTTENKVEYVEMSETVLDWHTTSIIQLLEAIVWEMENSKKDAEELTREDIMVWRVAAKEFYLMSIQTQINNLTEVIQKLK